MEEKVIHKGTVVYLLTGDEVDLALKLKNIGAGSLNSWGGGTDPDETLEECAVRELKEESGGKISPELGINADPNDLEKVAIIDFHNTKDDGTIFVAKVHFYFLRKWTGTAIATDEMGTPYKYSINDLPLDEMMLGDRDFVPQIFAGKKVVGSVYYRKQQSELVKPSEIFEVEVLPE